MLESSLPFLMFLTTFIFLLSGYPVALSLGGSAFLFSLLAWSFGVFDWSFFEFFPQRLMGTMLNESLLAIPLFVFMGVILEKSKIAEDLLLSMSDLFGRIRGGLAISVCLVGGLLAASTGIVGATVVTMGLISLPTMLQRKYSGAEASGIICASGTLGQIIPPSIVLIILGDSIGSAHQEANNKLQQQAWSTGESIELLDPVSVADLFAGALVPGILLMLLYMFYIGLKALFFPQQFPKAEAQVLNKAFLKKLLSYLAPPLVLIVAVLGSILTGAATPTEAASVGGVGALLLAFTKKRLKVSELLSASEETTEVTSMVFLILFGATLFSLVFKGLSGDLYIEQFLGGLSEGPLMSFLLVMAVIFVLGFFLDFFEICFVIVPIVAPVLITLGLHPIWLGVMIALNLQTSFLTPPFGFSLFYLRGVAPPEVKTTAIYRGVVPYIGIQILLLLILFFFPQLVTSLPHWLYG